MIIDPNITFSNDYCHLVTGVVIGQAIVGVWLLRIFWLCLFIIGIKYIYKMYVKYQEERTKYHIEIAKLDTEIDKLLRERHETKYFKKLRGGEEK
jgi:hypothetical protein